MKSNYLFKICNKSIRNFSSVSKATKPITPNFTTKVQVAEHKLKDFGSWINESLIPESIKELEERIELNEEEEYIEEKDLTKRKNNRRDLTKLGAPNFWDFVEKKNVSLTRKPVEIFQMNIGLYCNQSCNHCHVESSPKRKEEMSLDVINRCLELIEQGKDTITTIDITGGAPELMTHFRYLVESVRKMSDKFEIIDRCNLTVISEPGQDDLVDFLKKHKVTVVASLPCYSRKNVNLQRGKGVFEKSIYGLLKLNAAGFGIEGSDQKLHLVYNPIGPFLPPEQKALQEQYKIQLKEDFEVQFNNLFTITNMPIKRFADFIHRRGDLVPYMELLVNNFNPAAVDGLMCRNTLSIKWDGTLYDCDFNQQLDLGFYNNPNKSIFNIKSIKEITDIPINTEAHCFGCTAGAGSSCQGATI